MYSENGPKKPCWRSVPPLALFCAGRWWRGGRCAGWGKSEYGHMRLFPRGGRDVPDRRAFFAAAHCAAR